MEIDPTFCGDGSLLHGSRQKLRRIPWGTIWIIPDGGFLTVAGISLLSVGGYWSHRPHGDFSVQYDHAFDAVPFDGKTTRHAGLCLRNFDVWTVFRFSSGVLEDGLLSSIGVIGRSGQYCFVCNADRSGKGGWI